MTRPGRPRKPKGSASAEDRRRRKAALLPMGDRIRALREQISNQDNFAAEAKVARSYYGAIERGESNITVMNLFKVALALNVEPAELMPTLAEVRAALAK